MALIASGLAHGDARRRSCPDYLGTPPPSVLLEQLPQWEGDAKKIAALAKELTRLEK